MVLPQAVPYITGSVMTQEDRKNAAVSETLGYILLFGIVTLSMGVIYVIGYPVLQSNMDNNVFESAEQSFVVLKSNMDRVAFDQTPVKVLKMKLQSSSISVDNYSSMTISYDGHTSSPINTGEIVFTKDEKELSYEMGGVFKRYSPQAVTMAAKPTIYVTETDEGDITTIGLVKLNGNDYISGKGIATLSLHHNSSVLERTTSPEDVTLMIKSRYIPAWERYLEETGFTISNTTESTVTAYKNDTLLVISTHEVEVDIA